MERIDIIFLFMAFLWGFILGFFYFGGLYWTLKRITGKRGTKFLLLVSFFIRTTVAMLGFWLVLRQAFIPFILTFLAFMFARFLITKKLGPAKKGDEYARQSG